MAGRGSGPDFVEALARGLDVLSCFDATRSSMTLSEVAVAAGLARPTARRLLLTLAELGYVRVSDNTFALTPKVLSLGMAYVSSLGLWDLARPHLEALVARTGESSSMAQLDGGDIVYVARVAVPKIIALRVDIGTRFPAIRTSQGKVLLAALSEEAVARRAGPTEPLRPAGLPGASRGGRQAGADPGPGPGLGARRRGAGARRTVGGRAGPGQHRVGPGGDERHRARGRDLHRETAGRLPPAAAGDRRPGQWRLGPMAVSAARPAGIGGGRSKSWAGCTDPDLSASQLAIAS